MTVPQQRELRGFDSYELRLGDELRGERACLGKSLFDVQRDLRIKACYIDAIENSDPAAIENQSFVAGYIRSYARYLKLDPEEVYRRFCQESGFQSARARMAAETRRPQDKRAAVEDPFGSSDLAAVLDRRPGFEAGPVFSAFASFVAVAALVGGIGYGAWTFLNNIQQVASAPSAADSSAVVSLTEISRPDSASVAIDPSVYEDDGVLAQLYRTDEPAPLGFASADGPIAAIDPATAGVFARASALTASSVLAQTLAPATSDSTAAVPQEGAAVAVSHAAPDDPSSTQPVSPVFAAAKGVEVRAVQEAWVRIDASDAGVLFSGLMSPGESFKVPADKTNATLKVGNAAGVIILVDGAPYGPMGAQGVVQSGISLSPEIIRASYPQASGAGRPPEAAGAPIASAAVVVDTRG